MEINIFDYITKEQIVDECVSVLRQAVTRDAERILSNMAYQVMFDAVDQALDGEMKNIIKRKTLRVIKNISAHTVFRKANVWEKPESLANTFMKEALEENKQVIFDRVAEIVRSFNYEDELTRELLVEGIIAAVREK